MEPPTTPDIARDKLLAAANACNEAARFAAEASGELRRLRDAIEREGYIVSRHMHTG